MGRVGRWELAVLMGILAAALSLCVREAIGRDLWRDEFFSLKESGGWSDEESGLPVGVAVRHPPVPTRIEHARPALQILTALRSSSHPPLYFLLLRAWREVVGDAEPAIRWPALLASLAAIVLLYAAVRPLCGATTSLWACALMAVAAPQIRYGAEVRGYSLALALVLGCCVALVRIEVGGPSAGRLVTLGGCALLAMLTQYHAAGPLLALTAYAAIRLRGATRKRVALTLAVAAGLWLAAWGPFLAAQGGEFRSTASWQRVAATQRADHPFLDLVRLPARMLAPARPGRLPDLAVSLAVLAVVIGAARRRPLALWAAIAAGNLALLTAVDVSLGTMQLGIVRYSLAAGPGVYVLVAGAAGGKSAWRHLPPLLGVALASSSLWSPAPARRFSSPTALPWRDYAAAVGRLGGQHECMLVFDGTSPSSPALMAALHYLFPLAGPVMLSEAGLPPVLPEGVRCVVRIADIRPRGREGSARPPAFGEHSSPPPGQAPWTELPAVERIELPRDPPRQR
jgi:hypothetical protein